MNQADPETEVLTEAQAATQVAQRLISRALYRHADTAGFVDIRTLLADTELPDVVIRFFDLELRFSIARTIRPLTTRFHFQTSIKDPAVEVITAGILMSSTLAQEEFISNFSNAIAIAHSYLVRPEATLAALLTNNESDASLDGRFFEILAHVSEYKFLPEISGAWAERLRAQGVASVDEITLFRQFRRIDQGVLSTYRLADLRRVVEPLYAFYGWGDITMVRADTLEDFFSDRGMHHASEALAANGAQALTLSELIGLLESTVLASAPPNATAPPATVSLADSGVQSVETITQLEHPEQAENYADFIHELKTAGVPIQAPNLKVQGSYSPIDDHVELNLAESIAETATDQLGLADLVDPDLRKKFIKKLFEGNSTDYRRYLTLIDQSDDWKQASVYVDAIFLRHKVNPYSKTAIRFSDIVYSRFSQPRS